MALTANILAAMLNAMQKDQNEERGLEIKEMKDSLFQTIKTEVTQQLSEGLQPIELRQSQLETEVSNLLKWFFWTTKWEEEYTH